MSKYDTNDKTSKAPADRINNKKTNYDLRNLKCEKRKLRKKPVNNSLLFYKTSNKPNNNGQKQDKSDNNADEYTNRFDDVKNIKALDESDSYLIYLYKYAKSSSLFSILYRFMTYFRRVRLISTIFKIVSFVLVLLRTGAIILIYGTVILTLIPLALLCITAIPICSYMNAPGSNRALKNIFTDKNVNIFFPPRNSGYEKSEFFKFNLFDLSNANESISVIVSPYFFSSNGIKEKNNKFYFNYRKEDENIIIIRKYYYFILMKRIILNKCKNITMIY